MRSESGQQRGLDPKERVVGRRSDGDPVIRLEIYGILITAFAVALLLALITFDPQDVAPGGTTRVRPATNAIGPIGAHVGNLFLSGLGIGAFAVDAILLFMGLSYIVGRRTRLTKMDVLGWLLLLLSGTIALHVLFAPDRFLGHLPGGGLGEYAGEVLRAFLSTPGTVLVSLTLLVVSAIIITRRSLFELALLCYRGVRWLVRGVKQLVTKRGKLGEDDAEPRPEEVGEPQAEEVQEPAGEAAPDTEEVELDEPPEGPAAADEEAETEPNAEDDDASEPAATGGQPEEPEPSEASADAVEDDDFKIVESAAMKRRGELVVGDQLSLEPQGAFELPPLALLDYRSPEGTTYDREILKNNAQLLETKLADYKVKGKVVEIHPGPVVTMYEFQPAPGIKISSIANLADDLAMALAALRIRIVAPIPGKNVVGIEIPNHTREIVWLKEILSDRSFSKAKSKLTLALGKDIVGNPTVMNLAKAPHVLVAGATGSGKSVAINSFIVSLLYQATPDEVRLILVDPKMLELSIYEGIPHLLLPVVTDPKQATIALRWAVKEMERRYRQMADLGVRNLSNYNAKVDSLAANPSQRLPERLKLAKAKREARGEEDPEGVVLDANGEPLQRLPFIVVIIDELADLMMVASKDVELSIARLAQMARASGIHLVLATQRPSVDVITGLIKANFPTRVSFQVASKIDSRTILDQMGAQNLLGMGDMLFMPPGTSALKRVHGSFVTEEEVHSVVRFLKEQGSPEYDLGILTHEEDEAAGDVPRPSDVDELYDRAVRIVAETRNASISFLQRKLKIGYNRSARIIEQMEEEGVVGPSDGTSRPREVLIDPI